ncbi:hypothetical protein ACLOJK_004771, partial [Asimina triloba]
MDEEVASDSKVMAAVRRYNYNQNGESYLEETECGTIVLLCMSSSTVCTNSS